MRKYLLRRLLFLLFSLVLATVTLFILLRILPGDPANALLPIGATPDQIAAAQHQVGSDLPIFLQFIHWVKDLASFHFGTSLISSIPVAPEISSRLSLTIPLTLAAFLVAVIVSIPLGFITALKPRTWYGALLNNLSQLGIAIPVFWVGIIFVYIFALKFMIAPSGGVPPEGWQNFGGMVKALLLPVATIALVVSSSLIRYVRSATLDVLGSDFLRTSRAMGSTFTQAMWRHGLRNAAAPVISILGIELATTFVGAVVVESVFSLPGLGSLLVRAIAQHDYPVVQGVLFISTLGVLLIGFLADLIQRFIDPRLIDSQQRVRQ